MSKHTLSVLVENKPGVLARIAALFSRRGFNIDSLAVGPTEHPEISRMTVVVDVEELPLEQVTKQLNKLVEVLKVVELEPTASVQREILLVKVRTDQHSRSHVLETVQLFRAKVVDVASDALTIEVTGNRDKLDALPRGPRAVRRQGARPVRHGGHRPRIPRRSPTGPCAPPEPRGIPTAPPTASPNTLHAQRQPNLKEWPTWPRCSTTTTQT